MNYWPPACSKIQNITRKTWNIILSISLQAKHAKCDSWMSNDRFWLSTIIKYQTLACDMNLQMAPQYNPLRSRPIQTGREMSMEPYPNRKFWFIDNPDHHSACGSVLTCNRTRSAGPDPLLSLPAPHMSTFLAPIKYLSSDCITTWSIRRLSSFRLSFTSRFQLCDPTSIRWVAIENPPILHKSSHYFITIQQISVGLHIWMQEVKEWLNLNNVCIDYVMIRSKLKCLIGAIDVGTVKWNRSPVWTPPRTRWVQLFHG